MSHRLQEAISAIEAGDTQNARQLLIEILRNEPDEMAWWYMSRVAENLNEELFCLRQVVALNPDNAPAQRALARLEQGPRPKPGPTAPLRRLTNRPRLNSSTEKTVITQANLTSSVIDEPRLEPQLEGADPSSSVQPTELALPEPIPLSVLSAGLTTERVPTKKTEKSPIRLPAKSVPRKTSESANRSEKSSTDIFLEEVGQGLKKSVDKVTFFLRADQPVEEKLSSEEKFFEELGSEALAAALADLTYPKDIWNYVDQIPYMPSRKDRERLKDRDEGKRVKIWEYFFRIAPEHAGLPQQREIEQRQWDKQDIQNLYQTIAKKKRGLKLYSLMILFFGLMILSLCVVCNIGNVIAVFGQFLPNLAIQDNSLLATPTPTPTPHFYNKNETPSQDDSLQVTPTPTSQPRLQPPVLPQNRPSLDFLWPLICCFIPLLLVAIAGFVSYKMQTGPLWKRLKNHRQQVRILKLSMQENASDKISIKPKEEGAIIDKRITHLKREIKHLQTQIPPGPSDDEVRQWLDEDLERLRQESIEHTGLANRLKQIAFETDEGEQLIVPNPMVFISPGELQDFERIPPPFRPPQDKANKPERLNSKLEPKPVPDRAKHLLARRAATTTARGYEILFAVYYIEHLMIADDMIIMHGFFFDFVTGKTTADKITEQYYSDVVAIEKSKEFRSIPVSYDTDQTIDIEDAPAFSLTLPSGERRTVTLVNQEYLMGLAQIMQRLAQSEEQDIYEISEQAKTNAENAVKTLRHYLRLHKGSGD